MVLLIGTLVSPLFNCDTPGFQANNMPKENFVSLVCHTWYRVVLTHTGINYLVQSNLDAITVPPRRRFTGLLFGRQAPFGVPRRPRLAHSRNRAPVPFCPFLAPCVEHASVVKVVTAVVTVVTVVTLIGVYMNVLRFPT